MSNAYRWTRREVLNAQLREHRLRVDYEPSEKNCGLSLYHSDGYPVLVKHATLTGCNFDCPMEFEWETMAETGRPTRGSF
jgi:hypothetical protein